VVDTVEMIVGLIVDKVSEVLSIDDENIAPPPSYKSGIRNRYIHGIGKIGDNVTLLLDCKKLFDDHEAQEIGEIE
jgi:purine-binding chemotaxis protein CheW